MTVNFKPLERIVDGEIHAGDLWRYMLSTDGSIFRKMPLCVAYPKSSDDVGHIIAFAREQNLTVHPRGAGSGLCGSALGAGIVIDFTKYMNRLITLDLEHGWFECEPGYRLGELEKKLQGSGLFFPPDPSSGEYATFGGMYATNASGAHSVKYGNVADYIIDAQVCFSNGSRYTLSEIEQTPTEKLPEFLKEIVSLYTSNHESIASAYPDIRCNVAGYNLRGLVKNGKLRLQRLLAGAEGTLGVVTRLKFRLIQKPPFDDMVVAFFDDIKKSASAVQKIMPMNPAGIEIMDKSLLHLAMENDRELSGKIPEDVENMLLIEFDAFEKQEAVESAQIAKALLEKEKLSIAAHLSATAEEKERLWAIRKAAVPILYKLKGERKILALIEDAAVPVDELQKYFEGIYDLLNKQGVQFVIYGHIAKGLMHTRPLLNLKDEKDIARLKPIADSVYDLVSGLNGTVSGEHGDGRLRSAYIKKAYPDIYPLFTRVKSLLDPCLLFNPDIITNEDPSLVHSNLRFGTQYQAADPQDKHLVWNEAFIDEIEMCHGCSKCTTVTTGTRMCPVFKTTRDEKASPRAKANILRALISGAVPSLTFFEKQFQQVVNYCVNCGSCYYECPSNVNIPKLALEAKARYSKLKGVALHDRIVTNLEFAAKTGGRLSSLAEPVLGQPWAKTLIEKATGISAQRKPVVLSSSPLRKRLDTGSTGGADSALYFAGCYASYIKPEIGEAAVKVLNKVGLSVITPDQHCCGLPMLSKGLPDKARRKVIRNLDKWYAQLASVDHLVVTCSSCGLSLLQEWGYLLEDDRITRVKNKLIHISSLVSRHFNKLHFIKPPPKIGYHMPCHLKTQTGSRSSIDLLNRIPGSEVTELDNTCCGMAGSWGLAKDNYDLSKTIGQQMTDQLETSDVNFGATDCPTCRMQMEEFSSKRTLHPIEIVAACIE